MTSLIVYGSDVATSTLSTACALSTGTGGTLQSKTTTSPNDSTSNYLEVNSLGSTGTDYASLPTPSGNGWLLDATTLEGQTIAAGTWSGPVRCNITTGTMTADLIIRFYKRSSGGSYTSIGSITLASQSLTTTTTSYSFSASLSSMAFATGDKLYIDFFVHPVSGGTWTGQGIKNVVTTSATQGDASNFAFTTPGYAPSATTSSRTVPATAALLVTSSRTVPSTAALLVTSSRTISSNKAALLVTSSRTVPATAALLVTSSRTVPATASLLSTSRLVPATAALLVTSSRTISSNKAALLVTSSRTVPATAALLVTSSRTIPATASIIAPRLLSGGATVFANGTGIVTVDNFRWTQFPDPALCCGPVLPQTNTSEVFWSENLPTNTSRTMYTSIDGVSLTDVSSQNGGTIPGITSQGTVQTDLWTSDTSANYTNTHKTGGSNATATYDTSNSRVTLSGGSGGLYLLNAVSSNKVDVLCDQDKSDAGGLCWCYVDSSNYYEVGVYDDSSSGGFTNSLRLYKVASNVRSLLGSASISFPRSTAGTSPYHRTRVTMASGVINVYFDSTAPVITYTDGSPLAAGLAGLRNDGGTSRYYQLRVQALGDYNGGTPVGDIVTSTFVYTKQSLSTTDPTVSPQILDLTTAVRSPSVDTGEVITQLHDPSKPFAEYFNRDLDTISQASGDYHWNVDLNKYLSFNLRGAKVSPWCLYSTDLLFAPGVTPAGSADLYCNQVKVTNVIFQTAVQTEQKVADGSATSWQMAYPLYSAPTIIINGVTQTVGIQGQDTGKAFYWQSGSASIGQDSTATKLANGTIINFSYVGQYFDTVTVNNLTEQAARAAVEKNSGIVCRIVDGSTVLGIGGQNMTQAQATTYAQGLLARFGVNNAINLTATTTSDRLGSRPAPFLGMLMPTFLPEYQVNNTQLLVTKVTTTATQKADGNVLYYYAIEATNGANLSNWVQALL